MNTVKRFWALCLDTHMKLTLYKYAIIIIIIIMIDGHTDTHTHTHTHAGNDNTRRPKLASGKNDLFCFNNTGNYNDFHIYNVVWNEMLYNCVLLTLRMHYFL